ncbi:MAG TPA: accessory gene regulator B family protein [Clostridiaceae bacterium]|jgi:accessory gene regulator B|nr:accessory gene regulator B family protein [Clostridiaceae bacterium]
MIDKICDKLIKRIRAKMPEVDDERAEVIKYGLELIIGELPKMFLLFVIAWLFGIFKYALISFAIILPYKLVSGGVHLKTHIGCILGTSLLYCGNVFISKYINIPDIKNQIIFSAIILIFAIIMISLYAPADTENVPILRKKERAKKKIISYIIVTSMIIISFFVKDKVISNMFRVGVLLQSIMISKLTYNIFKVKFGYLEYIKTQKNAI